MSQLPQHRSIAIFIDFENLALGLKSPNKFEIKPVIKRLLEKGKIVAKRAYCDWSRFSQYTSQLHEAAIELIEIPKRGQTGKNSADIRLCVDAMDLAYSKDHIDTFVIVSGDSDFSPLVSKLKELGKHVIGLGMTDSTSNLLRDNCDEFIYYEDLLQNPLEVTGSAKLNFEDNRKKAFSYLFEGLQALRRENREVLNSPLIKITIKRLHPAFDENQFGYRNWTALLMDAQKEGLLELTTDLRSRSLVVLRFGEELKTAAPPETPPSKRLNSEVSLPTVDLDDNEDDVEPSDQSIPAKINPVKQNSPKSTQLKSNRRPRPTRKPPTKRRTTAE
ncbi:MAG: NYN domain-containing protein [Proteobacteria bacterium]|nr:NYN domain-containing protein [Pseudomonadota bacterium]